MAQVIVLLPLRLTAVRQVLTLHRGDSLLAATAHQRGVVRVLVRRSRTLKERTGESVVHFVLRVPSCRLEEGGDARAVHLVGWRRRSPCQAVRLTEQVGVRGGGANRVLVLHRVHEGHAGRRVVARQERGLLGALRLHSEHVGAGAAPAHVLRREEEVLPLVHVVGVIVVVRGIVVHGAELGRDLRRIPVLVHLRQVVGALVVVGVVLVAEHLLLRRAVVLVHSEGRRLVGRGRKLEVLGRVKRVLEASEGGVRGGRLGVEHVAEADRFFYRRRGVKDVLDGLRRCRRQVV